MNIAMSTLRLLPIEESLNLACEAGYDGVEILVDHLLALKTPEKMIDRIKSYPLSVTMHASAGDINITSSNEGIRQESIRQIKKTIELCQEIGVNILTVHPGRLSSAREHIDVQWEKQIDSLSEITSYAKAHKVYIGIENMEKRSKEVVQSIEDLKRIITLVNNDFLGATLDLSHLYTTGIKSIDGTIDFPIFNVHVSQCVANKPHYQLNHENRQVDIKTHLDYLKTIYNGQLVIEVKGELKKKDLMMNLKELKNLI